MLVLHSFPFYIQSIREIISAMTGQTAMKIWRNLIKTPYTYIVTPNLPVQIQRQQQWLQQGNKTAERIL